MEENTVRQDEFDEVESEDEVLEDAESAGGYFVAGVAGGFLAYAVVSAAKKLVTFVRTKLTERKAKKANEKAEKDGTVESPDKQDSSGEEPFDD